MGCVLVVDDDAALRGLVAKLAHSKGHRVLEAANAREATAKLEEGPDLVLLDIMMPQQNGVDWLVDIRKRRAGVPMVVFVTGDALAARAAHITGAGALATLEKPFRMEALAQLMDAMLPADDAS